MKTRRRPKAAATSPGSEDRAAWIKELQALHKRYGKPKPRVKMEQVLRAVREERF